jgi:hypothetical protein
MLAMFVSGSLYLPFSYLKTYILKSIKLLHYLLFLYERETLNLTARKEHKLRVSENKVLRRIFKPERKRGTGTEKERKKRNSVICTILQILLISSNQEG